MRKVRVYVYREKLCERLLCILYKPAQQVRKKCAPCTIFGSIFMNKTTAIYNFMYTHTYMVYVAHIKR